MKSYGMGFRSEQLTILKNGITRIFATYFNFSINLTAFK